MERPYHPHQVFVRGTWLVLAFSGLITYWVYQDKENRSGYLMLTIPLLITGVILLPVFIYASHKTLKEVRDLIEPGGHWVHWIVPDEMMEGLARREWKAAKADFRQELLSYTGYVGLGGLYILISKPEIRGMIHIVLVVMLGACVFWFVASILIPGYFQYRRRMSGDQHVFIGPRGIYHDHQYTSWASWLICVSARFEAGLTMRLQFILTHRWSAADHRVTVIVPPGHEQQALDVQKRLNNSRERTCWDLSE